jgi:cysteine desulfurase
VQRPTIYLDHAATTPLREEARAAMEPFLGDGYGNPSAMYELSRQASAALDDARLTTAEVLNCRPNDIVFNSGGTESINAAIKGVALAQNLAGAGSHVITSSVEHHAVLHSCEYLEKFGFEITYVDVDGAGLVDPDAVAAAVRPNTVLVSLMLANNEVGTIEPVAAAADAVRTRARALGKVIPFHCDAVQAPGYLPVDVSALGIDLLSLSAHKFGGPKGVGVLYIDRSAPYLPLISGGGQERQRRAGTENVAGIVGTAVALSLATSGRERAAAHALQLSERIIREIPRLIERVALNGHPTERLPNNVNLSFLGLEGDALVEALDEQGIAVGSGSACGSGSWEPSHVLLAMGLSLERAAGALRITVAEETTDDDVDRLLSVLPGIVAGLRQQPVPV